jgi:Domain of unknown function (DUF4105)
VTALFAAAAILLAAPRVQLVTMSEGDPLYERFGHAALRVSDQAQGADLVYNFGTTDFTQPHLFRNFLRGHVRFWVSVGSWRQTLESYRAEDRSLWLQDLHLSAAEQQALADRLRWQALPPNRYYDYDHFWDNCTTRVRDLLDQAAGGRLRAQLGTRWPLTLRELALGGFHGLLGLQLGTDLLLGPRVDEPITRYQAAFLPRILAPAVMDVKLPDGSPLASPPMTVYARRAPPVTDGTPAHTTRFLVAGFAVLLALAALFFPRPTRVAAAVVSGALGLFLWGLAAYSTLPLLRHNASLLLFVPFDLGVPLVGARAARSYGLGRLLLVVLVVLVHRPPWELVLLSAVLAAIFWRASSSQPVAAR